MKNASLWRASAEAQDYEEPDPPHPNDRMHCGKGHFVARNAPSRGWVMYYTEPYDGPHYRPQQAGERADEAEIYCATCKGWFTP